MRVVSQLVGAKAGGVITRVLIRTILNAGQYVPPRHNNSGGTLMKARTLFAAQFLGRGDFLIDGPFGIARLARGSRPKVRRFAALFAALLMFWAPHYVRAAQPLSYLQIPTSGSASLPQVYNLPGYGNVRVSVTNSIPVTYFDQINAYNQSAGGYFWGTDTQRFSVLNTTGAPEQYQFDFTFLSGAPNPSDLELVVVGLATGTTATVSQSGTLTGEYTFPASGFYPFGPSSTTNLVGPTLGSIANGDALNTGWALYQPSGSFTTLSLSINQISGDGIGFTLGYVPEPSTVCLLGVGSAGLGIAVLRKRRIRAAL